MTVSMILLNLAKSRGLVIVILEKIVLCNLKKLMCHGHFVKSWSIQNILVCYYFELKCHSN